jgi:serine protease Do
MKGEVVGTRRRGSQSVWLVLLIGVLLGGGVVAWGSKKVMGDSSRTPAYSVSAATPVDMKGFANGFAGVVKPALPTVVNISTSKVVKPSARGNGQFFNDPFFQQFFGNQFGQQFQQKPQREESLGSGVIVSADGYILTNNHVVDGATDIKVETSDKRDFTAKLVGTDTHTDIAVLKINATNLPSLPLSQGATTQVGDIVLAIGDPFGVGETVTMGIVSAMGRGGLGIEGYEDFIQTDAAINPGNSGGALINTQGECVGINTAILSGNSGGNQGIGFAIPVAMARHVMDEILKNGKVTRGYIGVVIQNVTPELAQQFGLSQGGGALVSDITPGGPAAKAGITRGDIILAVDGDTVEATNNLQVRISESAPGTTVRLKVLHDGKAREVSLQLAELPEKEVASEKGDAAGSALDGVKVETLTPDLAQQLQLSGDVHGVVVDNVEPASAAAESGLQRGDVIVEVNRKRVSNEEQFETAISGAGSQSVLLLVNHGGQTRFLVVQPH